MKLNKIFAGFVFKNIIPQEITLLHQDNKTDRYFNPGMDSMDKIIATLKNKEVVMFDNILQTGNLAVKIMLEKHSKQHKFTFFSVKTLCIDVFGRYEFLLDKRNGFVAAEYTKNLRTVLDVFSRVFNIHFAPPEKAAELESESFFEAWFVKQIYSFLLADIENTGEYPDLLQYKELKPTKPEKTPGLLDAWKKLGDDFNKLDNPE